MDGDGVLRGNPRTCSTGQPLAEEDAPALIPGKHPFGQLLIRDAHRPSWSPWSEDHSGKLLERFYLTGGLYAHKASFV